MSWSVEYNKKYVIIYSNLNKYRYSDNFYIRLKKLKDMIQKNTDKKIIFKCKYKKNFFYMDVNYDNNKLSFKLLSSLKECLKEDSDKEEECIWIFIYIKPVYHSVLHWLNSDNCNIFKEYQIEKKGKFLINFIDKFNKYMNIPYCLTSDEAHINCYGSNVDLSLSQIFKYGKTYYERHGFKFDMEIYKSKNSLKLIKNKYEYEKTKKKIKEMIFDDLEKPLYYHEKYYFDKIIKKSEFLGEIMKNILKNNCQAYSDLIYNLQENNKELKDCIEIIKDAKTSYIKRYIYKKTQKNIKKNRNTLKNDF
jgi:hypothetical protein